MWGALGSAPPAAVKCPAYGVVGANIKGMQRTAPDLREEVLAAALRSEGVGLRFTRPLTEIQDSLDEARARGITVRVRCGRCNGHLARLEPDEVLPIALPDLRSYPHVKIEVPAGLRGRAPGPRHSSAVRITCPKCPRVNYEARPEKLTEAFLRGMSERRDLIAGVDFA